jgi:uncharacterized protein with ParB-like and HNH nuclease domain
MNLARIKGLEYPLDTIFDGNFFFSVPLFQRSYEWTTEQAGELLNDLVESLDNKSGSYFLGSLVLIKEDNLLKPEAQVVDGQQRLITLTILFSVLRYQLRKSKNKEYPDGLTERIFKKADVIRKKPATYLITLRRDTEFFKKYIQNENTQNEIDEKKPERLEQLIELTRFENDGQKNIKDNAELFCSELKDKSVKELTDLVDFIFNQCFMIVVSTPEADSAFRIFSILNDRGLNLSHTDILKSEIIGSIPNLDKQQDAARSWEDAEDLLGRDSFGELFFHIRMIKQETKLREGILKEFRKSVVAPFTDSMDVIEEIAKYARIYDDIRNSSYKCDREAEVINSKLSWLNKIDNKDWIPPAIFYASLDKNPVDLSRFLTDLERLAAGLMIRRADVNKRIKRYGDVLRAIKQNQDLYAETSPLQLSLAERGEIFEKLNGDLFLEKQFRLYVLLRLNEAILEKGVKFIHSGVTIEHVLPQTLPNAGQWNTWFSPPTNDKYVHKLGNLILLTGPKNHGNKEFSEKKEDYLNPKYGIVSFPLSLKATKENKWTKEVICRRQREQLDKLKEIWRL